MNIREIAKTCEWEVLLESDPDADIRAAYTSDLLSDVMAHAHEADILITIQAHNNAVAVASLAGLKAIVVCNRRPVPEDMIESARKEAIGVYRTDRNQFETSCQVGKQLEP